MIIHRRKSGKCLLVFHGDTFDTWIWFLRISPKTVVFKPSNKQWAFLSNKILPPRTGKNNQVEKQPVEMNKSSFPHPPISHWKQKLKALTCTLTIQIPLYIRIVIGPPKYLVTYICIDPIEQFISYVESLNSIWLQIM